MSDQVSIQIRFTMEEEGYPSFTDALYVSPDEWPLSEAEIEARKQERFDNFKATIDAAQNAEPVEPAPVDEAERASRLASIVQETAALAQEAAELAAQVAPVDVVDAPPVVDVTDG